MSKLLLVILAALAAPAVANAGDVSMRIRDVPLGARSLQATDAPMHFNMLGVHWRGSGRVDYRTRNLRGGWRAWREMDDDARPDRGSSERDTWRDGGLAWAGGSDAVQFRTHGRVTRMRAYYLWSRVTTAPPRRLAYARSPGILPRSSWHADEKIKRARPIYAPAVKLAVVHHTAGTNAYSPAQAAAIVRGIEVYHVKGNGWNDIGYNFLVDRYGTVYEGRAGGIERNVIGAHAEGFNTGTFGVAMIGNFAGATPPKALQDALVKLIAWRLDVAHVDPVSTVVYTSGGNAKFRSGKVVTLRAISGHRDTGPSECPGWVGYRTIPQLTAGVATTGLPKLYAPVAAGAIGGKIRFQARLSSASAWTVAVADARGALVAKGSGRGNVVDWTWDSKGLGKGPFTWRIDAGPTVRPATGSFGKAPAPPVPAPVPPVSPAPPAAPLPVALTALTAAPGVVSPNPDGSGGVATISFVLNSPAQVTASVADWNGGAPVTVLDSTLAAGKRSFPLAAGGLPDGRYTLLVTARAHGKSAAQQLELVVDRTLSGLAASPPAVSPNADGVFDTLTLSFALAQAVPARLEIRRGGTVAASVFVGDLAAGTRVLSWDGTSAGAHVPDGVYDAVVVIADKLGEVAYSVPITVDTAPPVLTLVDPATLRFQLGEPGTLTLTVNGQQFQYVAPVGAFAVPWTGGAVTSVSAQARDGAGNASAIVAGP